MKTIKIIALSLSFTLMYGCNNQNTNLDSVRKSGYLIGEDLSESYGGVDANGDGVRDDIERYISLKYKDHPELVEALKRYSKIIREKLMNVDNHLKSQTDYSKSIFTEIGCIYNIAYENNISGFDVVSEIRAINLNTTKRLDKSFKDGHYSASNSFDLINTNSNDCKKH